MTMQHRRETVTATADLPPAEAQLLTTIAIGTKLLVDKEPFQLLCLSQVALPDGTRRFFTLFRRELPDSLEDGEVCKQDQYPNAQLGQMLFTGLIQLAKMHDKGFAVEQSPENFQTITQLQWQSFRSACEALCNSQGKRKITPYQHQKNNANGEVSILEITDLRDYLNHSVGDVITFFLQCRISDKTLALNVDTLIKRAFPDGRRTANVIRRGFAGNLRIRDVLAISCGEFFNKRNIGVETLLCLTYVLLGLQATDLPAFDEPTQDAASE